MKKKKAYYIFMFSIMVILIGVALYFLFSPFILMVTDPFTKYIIWFLLFFIFTLICYFWFKSYLKNINIRIEKIGINEFISALRADDNNPFNKFVFDLVSGYFYKHLIKKIQSNLKKYDYVIMPATDNKYMAKVIIALKDAITVEITCSEVHVVVFKKALDSSKNKIKEFVYKDYLTENDLMKDVIEYI